MKLKKIIALSLSVVMMFGLAACGGKDNKSVTKTEDTKKETITVWAWDDKFNIPAMEQAKKIYELANPNVEIKIVNMAQDDVIQKLNTSLSSGAYDSLPNVVLIEDYRIQNFLTAYPGAIKEISKYADKSKFANYKLGVMTDGDKLYGVPFDSGVAALFYRTDYIKKAGYTDKDMDNLTWDKYIEIGKAVKKKAGVDMLTINPSDLGLIRIMMQSAGQWYVKADGTVNIVNNESLNEAVKVFADIANSGCVKQVSDWDGFVKAFQKGEVASVPTGCWIAPSIKAATDQSGKWAVTEIPRLAKTKASVNASNLGGSSWYVLDKVGNSDVAADFLAKTFASNMDLLNNLANDISLVSTVKEAKNGSNYSVGSDFFGGQKILQDFATWTEKIPSVNYGMHTYEVDNILAGGVQSVIGGADIKATLKTTETQVKAAIAQ